MTPEEYGRVLNRIRGEAETSAAAFYTYQEINRFALEADANYDKLNRHAAFWNLQMLGLQTTYFMGLSRLFDRRRDVDSLIHLLTATETCRGFFSKEALAERKRVAARDPNPHRLPSYLETVWQPTAGELRAITVEVEPSIRVYEDKYAAIRNEVFAHSAKGQRLRTEAARAPLITDIDMMFLDILEVIDMLHALYDNGANRGRRVGPPRFAREVQARTLEVLNRL